MITLITLCDLFWLLWLLPLLLGALITWLYWKNKYSNMVADYDGKIRGLNSKISGLEGDLADCGSKRAELEGDLAITKGRMRELESEMKTLQAAAKTGKKGNSGGKSSIAPMTDSKSKKDSSSGSNTAKSGDGGEKKGDGSGKSSASGGDDAGGANLANVASSLTGGAVGSSLGLTSSGSSGSGSDSSGSSSDGDAADGAKSTSGGGSASGGAKKSIFSGVKSDNLQIVEGIGPKMESVLKENGVATHADLGSKSPDELQAILGKYGDKYKIIDPTTWAQQAGYAARGDYDGLIDLQKKLDTGKDNASNITASKLEKYLIKTGALKAFKQDDLKAIEGIGPATEKLLHSNGIKTWRELANTEATAVKAMLTAAGSRFALGDPTTWPKQAELAADGKFDELREYQDYLDGGKG